MKFTTSSIVGKSKVVFSHNLLEYETPDKWEADTWSDRFKPYIVLESDNSMHVAAFTPENNLRVSIGRRVENEISL